MWNRIACNISTILFGASVPFQIRTKLHATLLVP